MHALPPGENSTVFILSVSSDIGEQLALDYLRRGFRVAGTYRKNPPASIRGNNRFVGLRCDVTSRLCGEMISDFMKAQGVRWNIFISCVGQLAPVNSFFESDFESWAQSVEANSIGQLRVLHAAHPYRAQDQICSVVFFAGGGTNNPFRQYSAYCIGKISLIKMCELLDDENPDLNVFIVGTGWVRTKIHDQTLAAGARAGESYAKTRLFIDQNSQSTEYGDIVAMINWGVDQVRAVTGGRNFSVVHDPWHEVDSGLAEALLADPDKFKLRRHGNRSAQPSLT
jgi:NAD(P)-dependent dehydrogenase (short-subunit alcohol dehydrogenase family)